MYTHKITTHLLNIITINDYNITPYNMIYRPTQRNTYIFLHALTAVQASNYIVCILYNSILGSGKHIHIYKCNT